MSEYCSNTQMDLDLISFCHVNTNEDGDRFVGIRMENNRPKVCFPIGYQLPDNDKEIRADIIHLVRVLNEFTSKQERLIPKTNSILTENIEFPFNAYRTVIEYYFSNDGKYYSETEQVYATSYTGKKNWPRTIKKHNPLVQQIDGVSSFVFTEFEITRNVSNTSNIISLINRYCVFEAFQKIGWLYTAYKPEQPNWLPNFKSAVSILARRLVNTNNDKTKNLFRAMIDMLSFMEKASDQELFFGTDNFELVWERLIDVAFGVKNKNDYFPTSRWQLLYGTNKSPHALQPDTIMIIGGTCYILDAKCYRYGITGNDDHLPSSASINKQITYGEYIEERKFFKVESIFNAFILPFNKNQNPFGLDSFCLRIGRAIGDWRENLKKPYDSIQGILMDTRHLMYHHSSGCYKEQEELIACINSGFRNGIPVEDGVTVLGY